MNFFKLTYKKNYEVLEKLNLQGETNKQYTFGVRVNYTNKKGIGFESGVFFSQKRKVDYVFPNKLGNNLSVIQGDAFFKYFEIKYSSKYIEMPVLATIQLKFKKIDFVFKSGLLFNINYIDDNANYYLQSKESNAYKVTLSGKSLGVGTVLAQEIVYRIHKHHYLYIEPNFKYNFKSVLRINNFEDLMVKHYNFSWGLGVGYYFVVF
jgi:hypothetical protein